MNLRTRLSLFAALALTPLACKNQPQEKPPVDTQPAAAPAEPEFDEDVLVYFEPLPKEFENPENPVTEEKIALGRMLYYDTRLSKNHDLSCNSCHDLANYGVDNEPTSPGHKKQLGGRNSPTVYNSGGYLAQFWDGRSPDLEDQAKGPILNPVEMAMKDEKAVVKTLTSIPGYKEAFKKAFPKDKKPITYDNMAKAIGAFERRLVTPGRLDKFLEGDKSALTDAEKAGLMKFATLGCTTCHNGPAVGGSSFQRIGQIIPYEDDDMGRFDVTKNAGDKQAFKVPSLRNIAKTAPYFHKGQYKTLEETVKTMAWHQLGKKLEEDEIKSLVTFLNALTGEIPTEYIAKPELPESGPKTPAPDPS